jgi:GH35 family endo-1,4-beta-xylanase
MEVNATRGNDPMNPFFATFLLAPALWSAVARADAVSAPARAVTCHPAVTAFFESEEPFVREVVLPNIETNRKRNAVLQIVTTDGKPLAGATVSAELNRHEFLFGHCDLATERDPKRRELLNDLFYYTCPGNATKWRSFARTPDENDFSGVDAMLDFCREHDIVFEWHFLSGYHPAWLETITPDSEKARFQMANGRTVLERYRDKVGFFQVINEDWLTQIGRAKVYADQTAWFSQLRNEFPGVELGVCDCWSYDLTGRLPGVDELKTRYPGINFISMHAHKPRQLWASPEEMYATYDPYLDSDVKIHVTEFGIILGEITGGYRSGAWEEDKLAEYFVQAMATAFSHKAVRAFNLWSNYEKFTGNQLFTEDGAPNAKYHAIQSLLHDKLTTRVSGTTDKAGQYAFRGFHGTYDVSLQLPSGSTTVSQIALSSRSGILRLTWNEEVGTLTLRAAPAPGT